MAAIFFHHVGGDLTCGKPEVSELHDTDTLEDAARAIAFSPEGAVPVWRPRAAPEDPPSGARFIGMISTLDIATFVAVAGVGDRAMRAVVGEVVQPNPGLLMEIDPGTRFGGKGSTELVVKGERRCVPQEFIDELATLLEDNLTVDYDERNFHRETTAFTCFVLLKIFLLQTKE